MVAVLLVSRLLAVCLPEPGCVTTQPHESLLVIEVTRRDSYLTFLAFLNLTNITSAAEITLATFKHSHAL